jgi:hypothetical protein
MTSGVRACAATTGVRAGQGEREQRIGKALDGDMVHPSGVTMASRGS